MSLQSIVSSGPTEEVRMKALASSLVDPTNVIHPVQSGTQCPTTVVDPTIHKLNNDAPLSHNDLYMVNNIDLPIVSANDMLYDALTKGSKGGKNQNIALVRDEGINQNNIPSQNLDS
eukprot:gnl/Chilomastix_caulleri/2098.p1 GENE.gnl/Chilomastix_caulleri/2098~~gnl/Chilomastix_caulleri/2098.p1  ORF type:complete len:117 (+),score=18.56 gnl/Chilomastix_caulleri/2098:18-368(+)